MQELCFIAAARTGTNHLTNLISGFPRVKARAEVFHAQAAWGVSNWEREALAKSEGQDFPAINDPAFVSFVRSNPTALLNVMASTHKQHDLMCFKIFPGHLSFESIEANLVARDALKFVVVKRRFLNSYISNKKAEQVGSYTRADTTGVSVELNVADFRKSMIGHRKWYHDIDGLLRRHQRSAGHLYYEADIDCPIKDTVTALRRAVAMAGIDPALLQGEGGTGLPKQDKNAYYAEKISNWPEFSAGLEQEGLYEAALSYV